MMEFPGTAGDNFTLVAGNTVFSGPLHVLRHGPRERLCLSGQGYRAAGKDGLPVGAPRSVTMTLQGIVGRGNGRADLWVDNVHYAVYGTVRAR
ncbi:MAG: hypothetical protein NVSMB65_12240 [Chloroflexota bacterium]